MMRIFQRLLINWFYPLLFAVMLLQTIGYIPQKGLPGEGIYIWPFRIFMAYIGIKSFLRNANKCPVLTYYLIYSFLSVFLYAINGYPIKLFFFDCAFYLVPLLFAYVGMDSNGKEDKFLFYSFYAIIVAFAIGVYLYFVPPSWYKDAWVINYNSKWYKEGLNASYEFIASNMRFSSFFMSSYATEYYGLFSLPFSIYSIIMAKNRMKKIFFCVLTFLILAVIVLSMQRAAIGASMLTLVAFFIYDNKYQNKLKTFFFFLLITIVVLIVYYSTTELGERVLGRFSQITIEDTFSDARTSQNMDLLRVWDNPILGNGLGTGGNEARKMGYPAVTDSNYVKILVEQGIVGFALFLSLLVKTLMRVYKNMKSFVSEGIIIICILIAMIGSNSLMFSLYIPPFWYVIGRIWSKTKIQYKHQI